jgi:uncharacterized protein with HEPN domain
VKRDLRLYLDDISESILAIEEYAAGATRAQFESDRKLQDAVLRRLEVIGEAVKALPDEFRNEYPDVPWKQVAGLRDVLIHEYFGVKLVRVWHVVSEDLPVLKRCIAAARRPGS